MSNILIGVDPNDPSKVRKQDPEVPLEQRGKMLPKPSGYHVLCAVPDIEDAYDSGLAKADITVQHEEILTTVLFVIDLGPDAYRDEKRFPSGAWCKKGDFVVTRAYAGTRVKIHGTEWRLINDDSVEAVVEDPRGLARA